MQTAMRGLLPAMFGQSPYGAVPTVASIGAVTRDSIVAAQREGWGPKGATLIVPGALSPEAGFALAERVFGDWAGDGTPVTTARAVPFAAPRIVAIDMPGAGQAAVQNGRAPVWTPVTNAQIVCRLMLEKKKNNHTT